MLYEVLSADKNTFKAVASVWQTEALASVISSLLLFLFEGRK